MIGAADEDNERCHWCQKTPADGGYGIEGYTFCDGDCADEWWQEWSSEMGYLP